MGSVGLTHPRWVSLYTDTHSHRVAPGPDSVTLWEEAEVRESLVAGPEGATKMKEKKPEQERRGLVLMRETDEV